MKYILNIADKISDKFILIIALICVILGLTFNYHNANANIIKYNTQKPNLSVTEPLLSPKIYPSVPKENKRLESNINCISEALYFEARNQPLQGQFLIAQSIRIRVMSKYYSNDVCSVVRSKDQFSYYWDGKPEKVDYKNPIERKAFYNAKRIAEVYAEDDFPLDNKFKYVTMYHASNVNPDWDYSKLVYVGQIGDHKFYEEKRVINEMRGML